MLLSLSPLEVTATPDDSGDLALVTACRQGNSAAWRRLYEQNVGIAYRGARRLGAPAADAEDVVHEAFEVAFRRLHQFQGGQFSSWLYRIVMNVTSARVRKTKVRAFFASMIGAAGDRTTESAEGALDARRQLERIEDVLRSLSAAKREVFALHELEGFSHQQIADLTGQKVETVRTRLHYAKKDFEALARKRGLIDEL